MSIHCPVCETEIRGETVDIDRDVAECPRCRRQHQASALLAPAVCPSLQMTPPAHVPPATMVQVAYPSEGGIHVFLPRRGMCGAVWGAIGLALFWNVILTLVMGGFIVGMVKGAVPRLLILFFVPFVIVGIGLPVYALVAAVGTFRLELSREGLRTTREVLGRRWTKAFPLQQVAPFLCERFNERTSFSGRTTTHFACVARAGWRKARFGTLLSKLDQDWLVGELNRVRALLRG